MPLPPFPPTLASFLCSLPLLGPVYQGDKDEEGREGGLQAPWSGKPFVWLGRNPLVGYVGHLLLRGYYPFNMKVEGEGVVGGVGRGVLEVGAWVGVTLWMGEGGCGMLRRERKKRRRRSAESVDK